MNSPRPTNEQTVQIVNAIRRALEKCKHHQTYSVRVHKAINAEINALFPGVVLHCGSPCVTLENIKVWGGPFQWGFDNGFYACWNIGRRDGSHWSEPILTELHRCDVTDVMERIVQEAAIETELTALERQAQEALALYLKYRAVAVARIATLPKPKSATLRTSSCHWDHPTSETAEQYPILFGKKNV